MICVWQIKIVRKDAFYLVSCLTVSQKNGNSKKNDYENNVICFYFIFDTPFY